MYAHNPSLLKWLGICFRALFVAILPQAARTSDIPDYSQVRIRWFRKLRPLACHRGTKVVFAKADMALG
jgi:hypothetical protein